MVLKPAEETSASAFLLGQVSCESGLPAGVLIVAVGSGPEAGAALVSHPEVRKLAFTGSVRAGQQIGHNAAERILPGDPRKLSVSASGEKTRRRHEGRVCVVQRAFWGGRSALVCGTTGLTNGTKPVRTGAFR